MKNLYILGANFFDVIKLVEAINEVTPTWKISGFVATKKRFKAEGHELFGYPFQLGREKIKKLAEDKNNYFFSNKPRNQRASLFLTSYSCNIATLVHPAIDLNFVKIGKGCILPEGCVVGGNAEIGNFVTVRLKSLISHDVVVEDYVFIGPSASIAGRAVLKKGCFIGQGAIIMPGKVVGEYSLVGAGAVVTKDVSPGTVVVGIPAKPIGRVGR